MNKGYVDAPSGQIHYREIGTGPTLILLHQTATTGRVFEPTMERLADRFRCVAFDTPGFGNSDAPPVPYLMPDYADAINAAATGLGIERFHLLGHHTGASIACSLAARHGERIDHLVLHSCPEVSEDVRLGRLAEAKPLVIDRSGAHVQWVIDRLRGYTTQLGPEDLHHFVTEYLIAAPRYHEAHVAVWEYKPREDVGRIVAPTLFLSGDRDMFVVEHEQLATRMSNARTLVLADRGRLNMVEDPDQYARVIAEFLGAPL